MNINSKELLLNICKLFQDNRDYLCKMDSFTGDGDHGVGMDRGFTAVMEELTDFSGDDSQYFSVTGRVLTSKVGGAVGPLYGLVFSKLGRAVRVSDTIDTETFYNGFNMALESITRIGKVKAGDKTLVDALYPAVASLKDDSEASVSLDKAMENAAEAALEGVEATKDLVAKKGRAKFLGERSKGYQDAGATSMYLLIKGISDYINDK